MIDQCYKCNSCGLPLPLRLPRPGEAASSWECCYCNNRFHATLVDSYPPEILANVRPSEDVNPRITIGKDTLASLYKRQGQHGRVFEGRESARKSSETTLIIMTDNEEEICVNTMDLSAGGIGFTANRPIEPGSVITVQFESLPGKPISLCIVRNCIQIDDQSHRIGAEFKNTSVV